MLTYDWNNPGPNTRISLERNANQTWFDSMKPHRNLNWFPSLGSLWSLNFIICNNLLLLAVAVSRIENISWRTSKWKQTEVAVNTKHSSYRMQRLIILLFFRSSMKSKVWSLEDQGVGHRTLNLIKMISSQIKSLQINWSMYGCVRHEKRENIVLPHSQSLDDLYLYGTFISYKHEIHMDQTSIPNGRARKQLSKLMFVFLTRT